MSNPNQNWPTDYDHGAIPASRAPAQARVTFIHKTYQHLALAIMAFVGLEAALLASPLAEPMTRWMTGGYMWLLVLGAFMLVSRVASKWAMSTTALSTQYFGLGLYVVAEAILFLPLLFVAANYAGPSVIPNAAIITGVTFAGLTFTVMMTKAELSFMGSILRVAGWVALGTIAARNLVGFSLGVLFRAAMVAFAAGAHAYQTSNIVHHYRTDQYVAASLGLFASVALLFFYVLRLLMASED